MNRRDKVFLLVVAAMCVLAGVYSQWYIGLMFFVWFFMILCACAVVFQQQEIIKKHADELKTVAAVLHDHKREIEKLMAQNQTPGNVINFKKDLY